MATNSGPAIHDGMPLVGRPRLFLASSQNMKRVIYANDYSSINHCGSTLLNHNLKKALASISNVIAAIPDQRMTHSNTFDLLANCDALVINGEGNFHSSNLRKLGQIYTLALQAKHLGKRAALVNTVAQDIPKELDMNLFDYVSVRESESLKSFLDVGYRGEIEVIHDATLLATSNPSTVRSDQIIVTDSMVPHLTDALRHFQVELSQRGYRSVFVPFKRGFVPISTNRMLKLFSQAALVISGRYHANYFALITGTPMLSIDANTHKTKGLMHDLGLDSFHFKGMRFLKDFIQAIKPEDLLTCIPKPAVDLDHLRSQIRVSLRTAIGLQKGETALPTESNR